MEISKVKLDEVKFAEYNPRKISKDELGRLEKSLREFGCVRPLIINKRTGILISGHQTVKAARNIGLKELPHIYVDLPTEKERALNLALNKISGEWDYDALQTMLTDLVAIPDFDIDVAGFTSDEVQVIVDGWAGDETVVTNVKEVNTGIQSIIKIICNTPDRKRIIDAVKEVLLQGKYKDVSIK